MIRHPERAVDDPERELELRLIVDPLLQNLIADVVAEGWGTVETMAAIKQAMGHLETSYSQDPDPAEDPVS
ncbi:hypothetical protein [Pararhizobium sp. PWRC1-1]|uniref:hypothetical protein n=1 Tax=Pararhizobium sp. PWRC1-1 TaxID=2804566 RepID=UPI003CE7DEF5